MASPHDAFAALYPADGMRQMAEAMEAQTAAAMEQLVAGEGFSELLARLTENAVAVSKIGADFWDFIVRNLRIAGRGDIERLARQLGRTEDKLEQLLQAIERLEASSWRE